MTRPLVVAISQRLVQNPTYPEVREGLDVRWGHLCAHLGLLPLVLPTSCDPAAYLDTFSPSALILTGGNDLASVSQDPLSKTRDEYEKRLLSLALSRDMAVLAVCRGMQLVAEVFGSSVEPVAGHSSGREHSLVVDRTSRFGRELGDRAPVRSYHDYAVTRAPSGFVEVARSTDGVLEAMEHGSKPVLCIMWHPEREETLAEADGALFRALLGKKGRPT